VPGPLEPPGAAVLTVEQDDDERDDDADQGCHWLLLAPVRSDDSALT